MKFKSLLKFILSHFKRKKSRSVLTILGVSIAISAVLFLVSFGYGLQKLFLTKITTQKSLLTLNMTSTGENGISITDKTLNKIKNIKGVDDVSTLSSFQSQVEMVAKHSNLSTSTTTSNNLISQSYLNVVDKNFFSLYGTKVIYGKVLSASERNDAVANASLSSLMGNHGDEMVNNNVVVSLLIATTTGESQIHKINNKFKIIGIVNDGSNNPQLYIEKNDADFPITTYQLAKVKVKSSNYLSSVRSELVSMGFFVSSVSDIVKQANRVFNLTTIIFAIFGIVAVFVAAIGLLNTMTITLLERTNEIGIMRAIGASPKDIKKTFLVESSIIGFLGGFVGIFLGIAISQIFNWLVNLLAKMLGGGAVNLFYYPIWFMLFIIAFSTLIGFISGYFPARRAAKLNPLKALRYK